MRKFSALDIIVYQFQLSQVETVERGVADILVRTIAAAVVLLLLLCCCCCCVVVAVVSLLLLCCCCFCVVVAVVLWLLLCCGCWHDVGHGTSCFPLRLQVHELLY